MPADLKSDLEFDAHRAIVTSGLPQPQTNVVVRAAGREFVVDLLWPDQRLIAEIDGPAHRSKRSFESDRERDSLLQLAGYRIVRFTKKRLRTDRQAVIDEIAAHLA
ncbi:MAG TPA: DUF559 domain-containing protein [Baekduia sp.]|nr:DUF559 domain-containing protein [Baekduia sp.]